MTGGPVLRRGIGRPTTCRSCKAPIVFAVMASSGKLSPFQRDDVEGEWVLLNGIATHQGRAPAGYEPEQIVPRWKSHFASCPSARLWRRR